MAWVAPAIMGGLSLLQGMGAQSRADKMRAAEAETTRYSPWTGLQGHAVQDPDLLSGAAQGVASGLAYNQAADKLASDQKFQDAYLKNIAPKNAAPAITAAASGGSPWSAIAPAMQGQGLGVASQSLGGSAGALGPMNPFEEMAKQKMAMGKMYPGYAEYFSNNN